MRLPPEHLERVDTPHGVVAIVDLADDHLVATALALLPAAERAHAQTLSLVRRRELVAGRTALHALLGELDPNLASAPILADDRGAPSLPAGWFGSVSHKGTRAAALVTPAGEARVGIDLELAEAPRADIGRRILTERERRIEIDGRGTTLRFSIKEAIYKAVDPFVRRYVGFTEVELEIAEGCAHVTTELPFAIETTWREHAGYWLSTARALRR
ncbi:MAG: 4'-phosphopantetheinyl transferase superfamily protein [Kofleriaceae bacterium]|nr:4'-phosphopantetheinyl transferase superfamily protein [Kofleriaceae bacterium]